VKPVDVVVVGGGVAGMSAAALLGNSGLSVRLLEASPRLGGKAGSIFALGGELDTGPSVLTLPHVLEDVFEQVGLPREERLEYIELNPGFRYLFPEGGSLVVYHDLDRTLDSVAESLGSKARDELQTYLGYAERIWTAAAPHFVFAPAPDVRGILKRGFGVFQAISKIDALRTLARAIDSLVKTPELRLVLRRYATYNGSDARSAPATLGCIAHVELALGGFGVRGGMRRVVDALERCLHRAQVEVMTGERVEGLLFGGRRVSGVTTRGASHLARAVLLAADPWQWLPDFPQKSPIQNDFVRSMSAYNGLIQSTSAPKDLAPHTVIFPKDYEKEFSDIFDARRVPRDPTIYVCAQDRCHGTRSFESGEPLFTMINAPALESQTTHDGPDPEAPSVQKLVRDRLTNLGFIQPSDADLWHRTPRDLAREFPGSQGALYGPASNGTWSAFERLPNEVREFPGLFLASGAVHPGGGVPLAILSGKTAATLIHPSLKARS
jgi:1-hydroxycarotenoid 3,4-desaturase